MGTVPLLKLLKIPWIERSIPALCLAASLIGAGFVFFGGIFNADPSRQVMLDSPGLSGSYTTCERTVGGFLEELGISISEYDHVVPSPVTPIKHGLAVSYIPAKQVYIADAGLPGEEVMCAGKTVCDLLAQCGLDIGPLDRVEPHPSTPLETGMLVDVTRVEVMDVTTEREIEPPLRIEPDPELPRGRMVDVDPGCPGISEDVIRYYYRNGEETARVEIGSRVMREPEERVARVGVRSMPPIASRGGLERDVMEMDATAYDPGPGSCFPYADGKTATGHRAGRGVCAVDPNVIPLGTELWIEGYGYALACDVGGAIKGNRIDVCYDTRAEAMQWGRRKVLVYILD